MKKIFKPFWQQSFIVKSTVKEKRDTLLRSEVFVDRQTSSVITLKYTAEEFREEFSSQKEMDEYLKTKIWEPIEETDKFTFVVTRDEYYWSNLI